MVLKIDNEASRCSLCDRDKVLFDGVGAFAAAYDTKHAHHRRSAGVAFAHLKGLRSVLGCSLAR